MLLLICFGIEGLHIGVRNAFAFHQSGNQRLAHGFPVKNAMDIGAIAAARCRTILYRRAAPCDGCQRLCAVRISSFSHVDFIAVKCRAGQAGQDAISLPDGTMHLSGCLVGTEGGMGGQQSHAVHAAACLHAFRVV